MYEDCLPSWCEGSLIDSREFSRAYNNISSTKRALLKKQISELTKWYNFYKYALDKEEKTLYWTQNWVTRVYKRPLDSVFIGLFEEFASPALLLSAVLPPKIAGVNKVRVFKYTKNRHPWADSLLLALELAGIQEVYNFSVPEVKDLLKEIQRYGIEYGWISFEQPQDFNYTLLGEGYLFGTEVIPLVVPRKCGIWIEGPDLPDFESLEFAHPRIDCEIWSGKDQVLNDLPDNFARKDGSWEEFCQKDFDLVWAPKHLHREVVSKFPVVLSSGQESSWIWRGLGLERFQAWGVAFSGFE